MTTTPWAVKYRPKDISDIVGNDDIVDRVSADMKDKTLSNRLFITGPTGSGKTSLAYVLAEWFSGVEYSPDAENAAVREINGADCGIDDVRKLIDGMNYRPLVGKARVVIIDECQDLTPAAKKILNKPLESESDVVWIMVTDQPHKISDVLRGRMNRLDMAYPGVNDLVELGEWVFQQEKLKTPSNLEYVARQVPNVRLFLNVLQDLSAHGYEGDAVDTASLDALLVKHLGDQSSMLDSLAEFLGRESVPTVNVMEVYNTWTDIILHVLAKRRHSASDRATPNFFRNKGFELLRKVEDYDLVLALKAVNAARTDVVVGGCDGMAALIARSF